MSNKAEMRTLAGLATARGFASGPAFLFRGDSQLHVSECVVESGHEKDELLRLQHARVETRRDLESLIAVLRERTGRDDVQIFEGHLMILDDPILVRETDGYILNDRLNAEAAVRRSTDGVRAQFARMNDAYFRERVRDIDDVERRLLQALTGFRAEQIDLQVPSIVVADDLTPSEAMRLPHEFLLGFATNGGSTTSHVALLARAMGVPAVTGLGTVTSLVRPESHILLDGTNGTVTIDPDDRTRRAFEERIERQKAMDEELSASGTAGQLKDGGRIRLYANAHTGVSLGGLAALGACGIGLYRSEFLWLNRELEPTEDEQFAAYRAAIKATKPLGSEARCTIRLLDIGGDKAVRGISSKEANPFLGNRSIRYLLSNPNVFKTQLRAVLRASAFGRAALMYPMISCLEEVRACAKVLDEVKRRLDADGVAYDRNIPVGIMIEVPSAALNAEMLAREVDFFSIGTNDLVQYTMAADRGNEAVAHLYQPLNPAVLRLIRMTVDAARRHNLPVSVCGESAADPICGVLWAAMGIDRLSMSATYIPTMSKVLSRLTRADLNEYRETIAHLESAQTGAEIAAACRAWMKSKAPDLESISL